MGTVTDEMIVEVIAATADAAELARETISRNEKAQTKGLPSGPTPEAIERYRAAVFAAGEGSGPEEPDPNILQDAWKLTIEWHRDLKMYKKRLAARKALDETVPKLQAELRDAQEKAAVTLKVGDRPVSEVRHRQTIIGSDATAYERQHSN